MSIGNENVRSRLKTMKRDYLAAKAAVEASGFGFSYNLQTKCIDADHVAWEKYCKRGLYERRCFLILRKLVLYLGVMWQLGKGAMLDTMMRK
ncbi:hypothetical protein IFM89_039379 [Coptis chinensis]|uniref:Myb/SANT-like domain-containing protein n=1 Tax=Coptis chinensis TaxID=261450 RepID=A0A835IK21_9MAGN|nr:hypothetical protein IFM89_039379 [Coptis chinensis]